MAFEQKGAFASMRLHNAVWLRIAFAVIAVVSITPHKATADEIGNSTLCREQCNYDGNGNNGSCYWMCMSNRRLYDNAPNESMRPMPRPPTLYGAIAVETATLISGYAKGAASKAAAETQALSQCYKAGGSVSGCKIVVSTHNSCLALATSGLAGHQNNSWGYAWSDDGWVSRKKAMKACRDDGGVACKISVTFCTG